MKDNNNNNNNNNNKSNLCFNNLFLHIIYISINVSWGLG